MHYSGEHQMWMCDSCKCREMVICFQARGGPHIPEGWEIIEIKTPWYKLSKYRELCPECKVKSCNQEPI